MSSARAPEPARSEISLIAVLNVLLRRRRAIIGAALALAAVVSIVTLLSPRSYSATTSILPQSGEGSLSGLLGLAAQFGVAVPTGAGGGQSPDLYAALVRSRGILGAVVDTEYRFGGSEGWPFRRDSVEKSGTLVSLLEIDADTPLEARDLAIEKAGENVRSSTDRATGLVTVVVRMPWPELSRLVSQRILELLNDFNQQVRSSEASAERKFVEARLEEVQQELRQAEDQLEAFLQRNRTFREAPALVFQHDRLQREVALRQQVVQGLTQSFEQARIEEVRNTPVFTIVQQPERPVRPDRRRTVMKAILALIVGAMLGAAWALIPELISSAGRGESNEMEQFLRLRREAANDLRRLVGRRRKA